MGNHPIPQVITNIPAHPIVVVANASAIGVAAATFMGYLPSVAAVLSIIWLTIQIVASIDAWLNRKRYYRGPKGDTGERGPQGPKGDAGENH